MMLALSSLAIAVRGIGGGSLLMAARGLLPLASPQVLLDALQYYGGGGASAGSTRAPAPAQNLTRHDDDAYAQKVREYWDFVEAQRKTHAERAKRQAAPTPAKQPEAASPPRPMAAPTEFTSRRDVPAQPTLSPQLDNSAELLLLLALCD